jgi:hypothetical protein
VVSLSLQLRVLAVLDEPRHASEVADVLGEDEFAVTEAVDELEAGGLVDSEGFGAKVRFVAAEPELVRLAGDVRDRLSERAFSEVFAGDRARVLSVVDRVGDLGQAARVLDRSTQSVQGAVEAFREVGVVDEKSIPIGYDSLRALLVRVDERRARRGVEALAADAWLVWHLGPEWLFVSKMEIAAPEVAYGGFAAIDDPELDAPPTEGTVYYRTHRELGLADAICQALVIDGRERVRAACAGALKREQPAELDAAARLYGVEDAIEAIRRP